MGEQMSRVVNRWVNKCPPPLQKSQGECPGERIPCTHNNHIFLIVGKTESRTFVHPDVCSPVIFARDGHLFTR